MEIVYYGIQDQKRKSFFFLLVFELKKADLFVNFRTLLVRVPDDPSKQTANTNNTNRYMFKN